MRIVNKAKLDAYGLSLEENSHYNFSNRLRLTAGLNLAMFQGDLRGVLGGGSCRRSIRP
jgi:hypothetical protein